MSEKIYHCGRFPGLTLTVVPFGLKDEHGNKKPAKHLQFMADLHLGAGILRVKDESMQKYVEQDEYFLTGKITDVTEDVKRATLVPQKSSAPEVQTGAHSSADTRPAAGDRPTAKRAIKAARTPR